MKSNIHAGKSYFLVHSFFLFFFYYCKPKVGALYNAIHYTPKKDEHAWKNFDYRSDQTGLIHKSSYIFLYMSVNRKLLFGM